MNRHERLNGLLALVLQQGAVHVADIVRELEVSPATARRDLDTLAEQQLIRRTRGGGTVPPGSSDLPLRYKTTRQADEKRRIAHAAAARISPGEVVGLNGGTTTTEIAREMAVRLDPHAFQGPDQQVVIVTNAVNIANELTIRPHLRVVVTGGVARALSYELTGPLANLLVEHISIDTMFLGVNAFDVTGGAMAHHEGEASIGGALASRAKRVVVVADSTKLGHTAFARILPTDKVDCLLTDTKADPSVVRDLEASGVEVVLA
jgi:DeoR family transcriptional regulator, aga operon transcriptional repressor